MAQALDMIRAGNIALAADQLAGHFLAGHQALMDASWSQARYLEVADQGDQSATSAAILLETRKRAKASLKVESMDPWIPGKSWQRGWYGGGKSRWEPDKGKAKGKKGGKGKEKGGWQDKEGKGKAKRRDSHDKGEKEKEA